MPNKSKQSVLLIGSTGTVGSCLLNFFRERSSSVELTVTARQSRAHDAGEVVSFDLLDAFSEIGRLPDVDVVVICGGMTKFVECERAPVDALLVNSLAVKALMERFPKSRVLYVSSDAARSVSDVVCGKTGLASRQQYLSMYGMSKMIGEHYVTAQCDPGKQVIRLGKVVGPMSKLFEGWVRSLAAGESVEAFDNHLLSPVWIDDAVAHLGSMALYGRSLSATGSSFVGEPLTYLEFARLIATRMGADSRLVKPRQATETELPLFMRQVAVYKPGKLESIDQVLSAGYVAGRLVDALRPSL